MEITVEELVSGEAKVRRITERSHQICPEEILIPSDFQTRCSPSGWRPATRLVRGVGYGGCEGFAAQARRKAGTVVRHVYPFEDASSAHRLIEERLSIGKVLPQP